MSYVLKSNYTGRYAFIAIGMITWITHIGSATHFPNRNDAISYLELNKLNNADILVEAVYMY
jgi:hypothetical protein